MISFNGGGIRSIIPARLLERLKRHQPGIIQQFDLIAGTSSGAVLAGGFAYGLKPRFLRQMYQGFGEEVFADSIWDDLKELKFFIGADFSLKVSMRWLITSVVRYGMKITFLAVLQESGNRFKILI